MPSSRATLDLGVVVHGEGDQAVDVRRREPGVGERRAHRLGGQLQLAAAGVLGELGRTDARDRGPAGECRHDSTPGKSPSGHSTSTVPVT